MAADPFITAIGSGLIGLGFIFTLGRCVIEALRAGGRRAL